MGPIVNRHVECQQDYWIFRINCIRIEEPEGHIRVYKGFVSIIR
jgi:hypothetical protein